MVTFTDSNRLPIHDFFASPCQMEDIHISGLKEGEILVSYDPYLIIDTNGLVIGMNEGFKQFYHLDKTREVVSIITIDWVKSCHETLELQPSNRIEEDLVNAAGSMPQWLGLYSLETVVMIILMIAIWRVMIHEKD